MRKAVVWMLVVLVGQFACGGAGPEEDGPVMLRGHYITGFEANEFRECGRDEAWWITDPTTELYEQWEALMVEDYEEVYVELRATVSEEGGYGHLGAYPHEVTVDEVLEVRLAEPDDCE